MTYAFRSTSIALMLAFGLGVASCAPPPSAHRDGTTMRETGRASLMLLPRISEGRLVQAIVPRHTAESIARLVVIPMVETETDVYQPMRADGTPTTLGDELAISASQSGPDLQLGRPIRLSGLRMKTRYRILARAYDAQDQLISKDAESTVDVAVGIDDAPESEAIPVTLTDVPFAARTTVIIGDGLHPNADHLLIRLVTVDGQIETPVAGSETTLPQGALPHELVLEGLAPETHYRLVASIRDAGENELDAVSLDIPVQDDDAPLGRYLTRSVVAGSYPSSSSGYVDGAATEARFDIPSDLAIDEAGNLYVADAANHAIRKISPDGEVSTFAGGKRGSSDGIGTAAEFNRPSGLAIDEAGNLYVADYQNDAIRKITPGGGVTTLAGGTRGLQDGTGTAAQFNRPYGIAVDREGHLYVADSENHAIRRVEKDTWKVTTLAGSYPEAESGLMDGMGASARFDLPFGVAVDDAGDLYVVDGYNAAIRRIEKETWNVTTIAGAYPGPVNGRADGTGTAARFYSPSRIARDAEGNFVVTDTNNAAIRRIEKDTWKVTTIAGSTFGFKDGAGLAMRFQMPVGIAVGPHGTIYVTDTMSQAIRKID